jgi:hypothetical protein
MSNFNIQVIPQNNTLLVVDNDQTQVVITNPITSTVQVNSLGPPGPEGRAGASFPHTGSAVITGSLVVTGSIIATQGFTGNIIGTSSYSLTASYALNASSTADNVFDFYTSTSRLDDWASTVLNTTPITVTGSLSGITVFTGEIQAFKVVNDSTFLIVLDENGNNITSSLNISNTIIEPEVYFSAVSGSSFSSFTLAQQSNQIVDVYLVQDPVNYDPSTYITTSSLIIDNDVYIQQGDLIGNVIGTSSFSNVSAVSLNAIDSASIDNNNKINLFKQNATYSELQIEPFRYYNTNNQLNDWTANYLNYQYGTASLSGNSTITGSFSVIEIVSATKISSLRSDRYNELTSSFELTSSLFINPNDYLTPGIYFSAYPGTFTFNTLSLSEGSVRLYYTSSLPTYTENTYYTDKNILFKSYITGSLLGTSSYSLTASYSISSSFSNTASYALNAADSDNVFTFYTSTSRLDDWASTVLNTTPITVTGSLASTTVFTGEIQAFKVVNDSTFLSVTDENGNNITSSLNISSTIIEPEVYFSAVSGSNFSSFTLAQQSNQIVDVYLVQDPVNYDINTYITTSSLIIDNDVYIQQGDLIGNVIGTSSFSNVSAVSLNAIDSASIDNNNKINLFKQTALYSELQVEPFKYYNTNNQLNDWAANYLNYQYGTASLSGNSTITGSFSVIEIVSATKISSLRSNVFNELTSSLFINPNDYLIPGVYFSTYPGTFTFNTLSLSEGSVRAYYTSSLPSSYTENTYYTDKNILFKSYITGSLLGTSSYSNQALSSSYALTASFALNGGGTTLDTGSFVTTSSFNNFTASVNTFTSSYNTGSFTGSFTGSLLGISSFAISSSIATTASNTISQNTILTNQTVGALAAGTTLPIGTSLESILRTMLITYIPPSLSSLVMRIGGSSISTAARDVGNSFTTDTASFSAIADNPNGIFPISSSFTASGADIGTQTFYFGNNVLSTSNVLSVGSVYTINRSTAGSVTFTINGRRSDNNAAIAGTSTSVPFQFRNYLGASSIGLPSSDSEAQSIIDAAVGSTLDSDRAWTATCTSANANLSNFTYIMYPASYGDLTSITKNPGAVPSIGAFSTGSNRTITNAYGKSVSVKVYKSNQVGAFLANDTLTIV